jgi:hypothetical protein
MMFSKQERYEELKVKEMSTDLTDEEMSEHVRVHYEINPKAREYFRQVAPGKTPQDVWGVDTSRYK